MNEKELVVALQNGDQAAFRLFVDSYKELVLNTCFSFLKNSEESEDLSQEIFIELIHSIKQFRGDSKLSTWIYRITVNRSLNRIRKLKQQSFLQSLNLTKSNFNSSENPENNYKEKELNEAMEKALKILSEKQRIAFTLNRHQDLSYKEISEIMNLSLSSIESIIYRAKERLKELMKDYLNS